MNRVPVSEAAMAVGRSRAAVFGYIARGYLIRYRKPGLDRRTFVDLDKLRELLGKPPVEPSETPAEGGES